MGFFSSSRVRVRFVADRRGRHVVVRGKLSESDRRKLRRLLGTLPIRKGQIDLREDWNGRTRVVFDEQIPEKYHQPIRNLLGNLSRL
jgi:hypothetical protein